MPRNRLFPAGAVPVAATVLAGALTLAGCSASAQTSAQATGATKATDASAATSAPHGGHATIMVYSINSDGPGFRALVTGTVGDYGPAVTVLPDGTVNPTHTHDLELKLAHGSFRISIAEVNRKFAQAASHEPIYPRTCSDYMDVSAPAPIVAGSGTGSYRGITGSFRITMTADEVERRPCQPAAGFHWQVLMLAGHGTVALG